MNKAEFHRSQLMCWRANLHGSVALFKFRFPNLFVFVILLSTNIFFGLPIFINHLAFVPGVKSQGRSCGVL
jgi:hypothetical protein